MGKVERQVTYVLTDGAQVVLSKCIRRTGQDWPKYLPICKSFNAFSWEYQASFGGRIIATKRRAEASPAAQSDTPLDHVMVKFRDEEMRTQKQSWPRRWKEESDSKKEEQLFREPKESKETPAAPEILLEAMK